MITKKKLLLGLLAAVLIGGIVLAYQATTDDSDDATEETEQTVAEPNTPAADEGSARNADDEDVATTEDPAQPGGGESSKQSVTVNISQAALEGSMVRVRAFANVLEDGTCTVTFTKSGQSPKTYTGNTEMQTSYTQCNPFEIPRSEFPTGGTWKATVVFESATYRGETSQDVSL
jgi:hypothetical protein